MASVVTERSESRLASRGAARDDSRSPLSWLSPAMARLDVLLAAAVAAAERSFGVSPGAEPFRGLHITREEIDRLLRNEPGAAPFQVARLHLASDAADGTILGRLVAQWNLTPFDVDALLIALAPEIDVRYERMFAYLQDDVSRRLPSVDLMLTLLCESPRERLAYRARFGASAPLVAHRLVSVTPDINRARGSHLSRSVAVDPQIAAALLGDDSLDGRLADACTLIRTPTVDSSILEYAGFSREYGGIGAETPPARVRLFFQGADEETRRSCVNAIAGRLGGEVLWCDVALAAASESGAADVLRLAARDAWLRGALLAIGNADLLAESSSAPARAALVAEIAAFDSSIVLEAKRAWPLSGRDSLGVVDVAIAPLGFAARLARWHAALAARDVELSEDAVQGLADRLRLSSSQIDDAVAIALARARFRQHAKSDAVGADDLIAAARSLIQPRLPGVARKLPIVHEWNDLVLPPDTIAQLRELTERAEQRERVLESWGFARKLSTGRGVTALFTGAPGTGKTMAAQLIAGQLALDLYRIDLAGVVSKYIGETEKNLDALFSAAEHSSAILFFDEADALFGKRSEVQDAHDRYANIEVSYLLQKMDEYEGVAILATNLVGSIDDAFVRRLSSIIHFPFPDEERRARIWARVWPSEVARDASLDLGAYAHHFELSGGEIRNVALAATHLAAAANGVVTQALMRHALRRELAKLGRFETDGELADILGSGE